MRHSYMLRPATAETVNGPQVGVGLGLDTEADNKRHHEQQEPVTIIVAGAPVPKGRPRMTRRGFAYTPAATRKYEARGRLAAQEAMGDRLPIQGPCRLELRVELAVPASWSQKRKAAALVGDIRPTTRPDIDNYLKAAMDSINSIVQQAIGGEGKPFDIEEYAGTSRVLGFTMIVAVIDVILITAISTLGAFLYNLSAALLGGIEVTLAEDN